MRLQLIALACVAPSAAFAQARGDVGTLALRTSNYVDDDGTFIDTSAIAARVHPADEVIVNARYLVDVTSSASVDVVAAATERWEEIRHEGAGGIAYADGTTAVSADYVYSVETDWQSHTGIVGFSQDFLQHNLTVGVNASVVINRVGRADDQNFEHDYLVVGGGASAVIVGSPDHVFALRYNFSYNDGYQASPYRYASFRDAGRVLHAPETHPDLRLRHSATILWNAHVFEASAFRSHLRGYLDDWGVASITAGTEFVTDFDPIELGFGVRVYGQRGAEFYEDVYPSRRRYMTADRELSSFYDAFAGVRLRWHSDSEDLEEIFVELEVQGFAFYFPEFSRLPERFGLIGDLAFGVTL